MLNVPAVNRKLLRICGIILLIFLVVAAVQATTTEVTVKKVSSDGTEIQSKTVDHKWMEEKLPVRGDGKTHYYHQGPVFSDDEEEKWNPAEDVNCVPEKDLGAVKGTDVRDLCDLVGGMSKGDVLEVKSSDGFSKKYGYKNVYNPPSRQGRIVLAWYHGDDGYVPSYYSGMRLVFFADTSVNPYGKHVFGLWDMHECLDEKYWHYYYNSRMPYPTTTGLSAQSVSEIIIHSGGGGDDSGSGYDSSDDTWVPEIGNLNITSTPENATIVLDGEVTEYLTNTSIADLPAGEYGVYVIKEDYETPDEIWVPVKNGKTAKEHFDLVRCKNEIEVVSQPPGAFIFIDGVNTSVLTDGVVHDVSVGEHTITLRKEGYLPLSQNVSIVRGSASRFKTALTPSCGSNGTFGALSLADKGSVNGALCFICSSDYGGLLSKGQSLPLILEVECPDGSELHTARLQLYTDCGQDIVTREAAEPQVRVDVAGRVIFPVLISQNVHDSEHSSVIRTTQSYNPGSLIAGNGEYALSLENSGDDSHVFSVAGAGMILVTGDPSEPETDYWIYEGCDSGDLADLSFEVTGDMLSGMSSAGLILVSTDADGGDVSCSLNGNVIRPDEQTADARIDVVTSGVGDFVHAGENKLSLQKYGNLRSVILVIRHDMGLPSSQTDLDKASESGIMGWLAGIVDLFFPPEKSCNEAASGVPDDPNQREAFGKIKPGVAGQKSSADSEAGPDTPAAGVAESSAGYGGLYITSFPERASIFLDGKAVSFDTPHVFNGLKEGLHTVKLTLGTEDVRTSERKVWVYPDAVTSEWFDLNEYFTEASVTLNSTIYDGEIFTVDGKKPFHKFPEKMNVRSFGSFVNLNNDGKYSSYWLGDVAEGDDINIDAFDRSYGAVMVRSEPKGADIFIDGYRTGITAPALVKGISEGHHLIGVSKEGYLPSEQNLEMVDLPDEVDRNLEFILEPYSAGSIKADSSPEGAKIYLYGRYSGKKTPFVFTYMPIGTYSIGMSCNGSETRVVQVTVPPSGVVCGNVTFD